MNGGRPLIINFEGAVGTKVKKSHSLFIKCQILIQIKMKEADMTTQIGDKRNEKTSAPDYSLLIDISEGATSAVLLSLMGKELCQCRAVISDP